MKHALSAAVAFIATAAFACLKPVPPKTRLERSRRIAFRQTEPGRSKIVLARAMYPPTKLAPKKG